MKLNKRKMQIAMARALLSRKQLAMAAGLPEATVANVFAGRTCKPITAGKIAQALGVDVTEIIEE